MSATPKVSCIVIFYDTDPVFFLEALQSITKQSYRNYEILLVDDGSTNLETISVAEDFYAENCNSTTLLSHPDGQNLGMSASRNLGIESSDGEYITFLDSDDTWEPETLTEQVNLLSGNPTVAMVYGPIRHWYSWNADRVEKTDWIEPMTIQEIGLDFCSNRIISPPLLFSLLVKNKVSISGFMLTRDAIFSVGGYENEFRNLYEDQVFCAKICLRYSIYFSDSRWYNYRQHGNSYCSKVYQDQNVTWRKGRFEFLRWIENHLVSENMRFSSEWWMIKTELFLFRYPGVEKIRGRIFRFVNRLKV